MPTYLIYNHTGYDVIGYFQSAFIEVRKKGRKFRIPLRFSAAALSAVKSLSLTPFCRHDTTLHHQGVYRPIAIVPVAHRGRQMPANVVHHCRGVCLYTLTTIGRRVSVASYFSCKAFENRTILFREQ